MNIALRKPMSRRHLLRGAGASLALPLLNAMAPRSLFGASEPKSPLRMAFLYFPNGVYTPLWVTRDDAAAAAGQTIGMGEITGDAHKLPPLLEPLQVYRKDFLLLSGLATLEGRPFNEGGAHAPAVGSYLTGVHPRKSVTCGTSVDQLAAQHYGHLTRRPSLEIATPQVNKQLCDKYPCIVTSTLSWRTPTQPLPVETSPRAIFNRMFVDDRANPQRLATRSSILDAVRQQAKQLSKSVDASDRHKIDEWVKIQKHQFEQFGYVIKRLKETKDGDGTLFDHSMVTYGCALGDGGGHDPWDLPILLAGRAGGTIRPGRHLVYPKHTPLANLWLAKLERVGVKPNRFGDSTGVLKGLS